MQSTEQKHTSILLTEEEKRRFDLEAERQHEQRISIGRKIVRAIAIVNIVITVGGLLLGDTMVVAVLFQVAISVALMNGRNWARILFIVGQILGIILVLYLLALAGFTFLLALLLVITIVVIVLLSTNYVKEYVHWVKTGEKLI